MLTNIWMNVHICLKWKYCGLRLLLPNIFELDFYSRPAFECLIDFDELAIAFGNLIGLN